MLRIIEDSGLLATVTHGCTLTEPTTHHQLQTLQQKMTPADPHISKLTHLLQKLTSLEAGLGAQLIAKLLLVVKSDNMEDVVGCLLQIQRLPHDRQELVQELKKQKIDGPFLLALLWTSQKRTQMIPLVEAILGACSVDLMLTGQSILRKWQNLIGLEIQRRNLLHSLAVSINFVRSGEQAMKIIDIPL